MGERAPLSPNEWLQQQSQTFRMLAGTAVPTPEEIKRIDALPINEREDVAYRILTLNQRGGDAE